MSDGEHDVLLASVTQIAAERDDARRWAVRLEGELARALERERSQEILRERAEQDRDAALQRVSTASYEATSWRHQLAEARALLQCTLAGQEGVVPPDAHKPG